jgi:xanthine/uracil/vitamin C permease (AzgA family)
MLADALSTTVAPLLGTTTTGAYIESAAGIEEGKNGVHILVVAASSCFPFSLPPVDRGPPMRTVPS